jgi:carbon-monoxide dehydrogenase large subunit
LHHRPDSGDVKVVSYASVNDIGRVVSPAIVAGQVDGGAVQGIGQALWEQIVYDQGSSQLVTGSFMDYAMPRAEGAPDFRTRFDTSIPCLTNPLGAKGVGELGTIGATPATMNAVADALPRRRGVAPTRSRCRRPERVWQALQAGT